MNKKTNRKKTLINSTVSICIFSLKNGCSVFDSFKSAGEPPLSKMWREPNNAKNQNQHHQKQLRSRAALSAAADCRTASERCVEMKNFKSSQAFFQSFSSGAGDVNAHVAIGNNTMCLCVSVTFDHKVNSRFMSEPFSEKDAVAPFLCVGLVEIQNTITSPAWTLKFLLCKYHRMLKLNFYSSINRNKYAFGWGIVYEENFFLCNLFVQGFSTGAQTSKWV